jgi:hypothetical protein
MLSSSWHCHPHCNGVTVVDVQASLQSRRLCHCNNIVALVAIALLLLSSWCCCPHHNGIVAIIDAQASSPLSQWRCCPCCAGAIANIAWVLLPLLRRHCHPYCADLFALKSHGRRHRRSTSIVDPVELVCLRHYAGVIAFVMLALLPLVHWHSHPCRAGLFALVVLALCS